jgi:hypothetical protein
VTEQNVPLCSPVKQIGKKKDEPFFVERMRRMLLEERLPNPLAPEVCEL